MTWLDYYLAVKRGDLNAVKNAPGKDFRISLTMNKSAFELAALFGHLNLVEYFLQNSDKRKDFQLLSMVLKDGLRSGNLEISELLWNFIDGKSEMTGDFVMPAMDGRNLDCVKLVYDTPVKNRCTPQQYVAKAFEVGWCDGLKYVERAEDKEGVLIQTTMLGVSASQSMFVDLALNNMENVMKAVESPPSHRDWFRRRDYNVVSALATHKSTSRFMYWSVFELAAHFGHLDILKYLIEKVVRVNPAYYSLRKELRSAFKFALRNDQTHILEYLIEEGLVKPRPPFEYEGFKVNDAFLYLKEKTKHLSGTEGVEDNVMECMKVLVDNGASKPFPSVVREMTNSVFVADAPVSSVFAARLLAVLHCTRLRDRAQHLIKIDNLSPEPTDWFVKTWTNRDEFLTEILISYGANGWRPYLEADCLLVYFARPKARREHFIHCLNETGVEVRDRDLDRYFNHGRRIVGDSDDKRLSRVNKASYYEKVFSLQSLTRLSIYNQCLKVASESSKYASVRNLVDSIAQSLPKPLADYLQFSDVYETLSLVNTSKMIINRKVLAIVNSRTYNIQHHRNALRVLGSDLSESEIESEDETDSDDDSSDDDDDSDETESEESDD